VCLAQGADFASTSISKTVVEEDSDEDSDLNMTPEQMTLFVRKFNKVFKEEQRQRQDQD
jgi:hypothetical protein